MSNIKTGITRECIKCGIEYYVPLNRKESSKYCNNTCRYSKEIINEDVKPKIINIYNIVYKTKNIINNKEYIGVHKTNNLNDGYIGSGIKNMKDAIRKVKTQQTPFISAVVKYGYESFIREILYYCDNYEEALEIETRIVNLDYINNKNTYNVKTGGKISTRNTGIRDYDLTYEDGTRYFGKNVLDFCLNMNLENSGIAKVVCGKAYKSQGFVQTKNFTDPQTVIIVDTVEDVVYRTINVTKWCKENQPSLLKKSSNGIQDVLSKRKALYKKRWWACYEHEWEGKVIHKNKQPKGHIVCKVKDLKTNKVITIENIRDFCKKHHLDVSYFYKFLRKEIPKYKNFKLEQYEKR